MLLAEEQEHQLEKNKPQAQDCIQKDCTTALLTASMHQMRTSGSSEEMQICEVQVGRLAHCRSVQHGQL